MRNQDELFPGLHPPPAPAIGIEDETDVQEIEILEVENLDELIDWLNDVYRQPTIIVK